MTHSYKDAKSYSKNNNLQFNFAMKALNDIKINNNDRILDLGCGDGLITSKIAEKAPDGCVIGTDISEEMINFANQQYSGLENLRFMRMNASQIIFKNQFDLIVSFNALHWVKDQKAVTRGIANAVSENGRIALLFSHKKSHYHHSLDKTCAKPAWEQYFKNYVNPRLFVDKESYANLLTEAGLTILSISEEEMTYHFESSEKLKEFYRAAMANINQIPDAKKEAFLDDLACEYMTNIELTVNSPIPVSFWCLVVHAQKNELENKHEAVENQSLRARL